MTESTKAAPSTGARESERVIKLNTPIFVANKPVDTITIRRPKAKDLKVFDQAEGGDMAKMFVLLEALTNTPESSLDELDIDDMAVLMEEVQGFFEKFQKIGGKPLV